MDILTAHPCAIAHPRTIEARGHRVGAIAAGSAAAHDAPLRRGPSHRQASFLVTDRDTQNAAKTQERLAPSLSAREKEVLIAWLLADSKTAVARQLFITERTVKTHIQRIRVKYAAAARPAPTQAWLAIRAIQDGFLEPEGL